MCFAAVWNAWNTPSRLVANIVRHSSSVRSMKERRPPPPMPALAKQPSTRPNVSSVAFIAALTEAGSVTSQTRVSTLPDSPARLAAAALFLSAFRPQIETLQPWLASACAMPSPMPPLPPVITATRPERSKRFMARFLFLLGAHQPLRARLLAMLRSPWTRPRQKSNMRPGKAIPVCETGAGRNSRGNHAVQTRHARSRWFGRDPQARPSGGDERGLRGHAGRSRGSARRDRGEEGPGALRRADGRGAGVLHRRKSPGPQQPVEVDQGRPDAADRLPSLSAPHPQSALPDRDRSERPGGRRRHELRAARRHDTVRAVLLLSASLPPHRPGAGLRLDLALAAADRQGTL